jgi:hypothetical protein
MGIYGYSINSYWFWIFLMNIEGFLLLVFGGYFINGNWCLFYWWLLMTIILMDIDDYYIGGY